MSIWGISDNQASIPKFPKERNVRDVRQLSTTSSTNSGNTLYFTDTSALSVGMFVSGNNINVSSAVPGFFAGNVTIVQINTNTSIYISNPILAKVSTGDLFTFDASIVYNPNKYNDVNYDNNTYLVNKSRAANATFGNGDVFDNAVAHVGWQHVTQGFGFVSGISVSNVSSTLRYANGYVSFVGANTTPANAYVSVIGTNNVSVILAATGSGYSSLPTATSNANANNQTLIFTLTPGGRVGRVHAECLVALSNSNPVTANSASPYFPGA
jgi:hypothetical protein